MRLRISKQIPRRTSRTPMSLNCYKVSRYTHLEDINYNAGLPPGEVAAGGGKRGSLMIKANIVSARWSIIETAFVSAFGRGSWRLP